LQLGVRLTVRALIAATRLIPLWLRLRVREVDVEVRRMDYDGAPILLRLESEREYNWRLHSCRLEPGTVDWIETMFEAGDVFYDVGANVGAFSLVAFKHLRGNARIYAFEPAFATFSQLCRNVIINGATECIVPLPLALSDRSAVLPFNYRSLSSGEALGACPAFPDT
jgi:hypothetical protein